MTSDLLYSLSADLAGRYTVERELGRGGMAVVYLAHDVKHSRAVALKVLRPELAAAIGVERFRREVAIASRLQHPNILPVHDSGAAAGTLYYVTPYVEGQTLADRLRESGPFELEEAVRVTAEIAEALEHAHTLGIVHRDVKPENVLLSSGRPMVADFGIARAAAAADTESLTDTGFAIGTPEYMSPEQAGGERALDGRSDLYSLGCVLFEMLAGEPPFTGRSAQAVLARHMQERLPSLEVVRPTVPPAVVAVLEKALAKVPADRFGGMREFAEALETALREPAPRPAPRRRVVTAAVAAAVGIAAWVLWPAASHLDDNTIMVFPLEEVSLGAEEAGAGRNAAIAIEAALDHASPLKWEDGWQRLAPEHRDHPERVTTALAVAVARKRGARFVLTGVVQGRADSMSVLLRLHDAGGDSLVATESETGRRGATAAHALAIEAIGGLLARAILGEAADLTPLRDRNPNAVALWIQGEREYRAARFGATLELLERAVAEDSALAVAAMRGAQAASWLEEIERSEHLVHVALAHDTLLPEQYAALVHGLDAYLEGAADSAVMWLERALAGRPRWVEPYMALGEVYTHLLPNRAPLDSLAETALLAAVDVDSAFTPPFYHLTEIAVRRGDVAQARQFLRAFRRGTPSVDLERHLALMLACVEDGPSALDWMGGPGGAALAVGVAKALAVAGAQPACAEAGFRAVLRADDAAAYHWGAFLGLQGVLSATGRSSEVTALVDSALRGSPRMRRCCIC